MFPSSSWSQEVAQPNPVGIGKGWHQVEGGQENGQDKYDLIEPLPNCKSAYGPQHSNSTEILLSMLWVPEGEQARHELLSSESGGEGLRAK